MSRARFTVSWAESAVLDIEGIVSYVAASSPRAAEALLRSLAAKAESLATVQRRGRLVPELVAAGVPLWRELILGTYRLVYRVAADAELVVAVLDSRRDLEDLLLDRLVRTAGRTR